MLVEVRAGGHQTGHTHGDWPRCWRLSNILQDALRPAVMEFWSQRCCFGGFLCHNQQLFWHHADLRPGWPARTPSLFISSPIYISHWYLTSPQIQGVSSFPCYVNHWPLLVNTRFHPFAQLSLCLFSVDLCFRQGYLEKQNLWIWMEGPRIQ